MKRKCKEDDPFFWFKVAPKEILSDVLLSAMSGVEFGCSMRLLMYQWVEGTVPDNLTMLARLCRVTLPEMEAAWPMVSQWFPEVAPGKLANHFMYSQREVLKADREQMREAGRASVKKRHDRQPKVNDSVGTLQNSVNDSVGTLQNSVNENLLESESESELDKEQVLSTLAPSAKKPALDAGSQPAGTLPLVDGTDFTITKSQVAEWKEAFPAVDVLQQLREMKVWTQAHKDRRKTQRGIMKFVVTWLSREQDKGPAQGQNGAPANGTNQLSPTKQRANANRAALAEALVRRGIDPSCLDRGSNAPALPEPRPDGQPGGIPVGFRATGPEVLPPESHGIAGGPPHQAGPELLSASR